MKFHFSGNKVEHRISPIHLDNSKYNTIPATSRKLFNSWEERFCPQEGIKQVCIHQNKPLNSQCPKAGKAMQDGHRGSREGEMHCYTHLRARSFAGDTPCHTEMNDHSSRLQLGTAAHRKGPFSTRSTRLHGFQQSNALPCSASSAPLGPVRTLSRSLSPARGSAPGSTAWEWRKDQMNEMQPEPARCCLAGAAQTHPFIYASKSS